MLKQISENEQCTKVLLRPECILLAAKQQSCWFQFLVLPHIFLASYQCGIYPRAPVEPTRRYSHRLSCEKSVMIICEPVLSWHSKIDKTKVLKSCDTVA